MVKTVISKAVEIIAVEVVKASVRELFHTVEAETIKTGVWLINKSHIEKRIQTCIYQRIKTNVVDMV